MLGAAVAHPLCEACPTSLIKFLRRVAHDWTSTGMITPNRACQPTTARRLVSPRPWVAARQRDDGVRGEDSGGYLEGLVSTVSATVTHASGKVCRAGHKKASPMAEVRSCKASIPDAPQPRRSVRTRYGGRSPDLRITLLADAFPADGPPVARPVGVRPRSQWRVREGIAPSSRKHYLHSSRCNCGPALIILGPRMSSQDFA
jgi:hypothetical protein